MRHGSPISITLSFLLPLLFCTASGAAGGETAKEATPMAFTLTSPAFEPAGSIGTRHTCDGEDRSPRLDWSEPPAGTKSLALIVDDPDAPVGDWVHWVISDLPANARSLAEARPADGKLREPAGAIQGKNDFGRLGWGGPCPPPGKPHRYFFRLYAVDTVLGLPPGATKAEVERALRGHVLAKAEIHCTYARKR